MGEGSERGQLPCAQELEKRQVDHPFPDGRRHVERQGLRDTWTSELQTDTVQGMGAMEGMGSHCSGSHLSLCSSDLKPQKSSIPDWAIVLITLTLVAAIVGLMYGVKMVSEAVILWGWHLGLEGESGWEVWHGLLC